jgi:hypothetical protein
MIIDDYELDNDVMMFINLIMNDDLLYQEGVFSSAIKDDEIVVHDILSMYDILEVMNDYELENNKSEKQENIYDEVENLKKNFENFKKHFDNIDSAEINYLSSDIIEIFNKLIPHGNNTGSIGDENSFFKDLYSQNITSEYIKTDNILLRGNLQSNIINAVKILASDTLSVSNNISSGSLITGNIDGNNATLTGNLTSNSLNTDNINTDKIKVNNNLSTNSILPFSSVSSIGADNNPFQSVYTDLISTDIIKLGDKIISSGSDQLIINGQTYTDIFTLYDDMIINANNTQAIIFGNAIKNENIELVNDEYYIYKGILNVKMLLNIQILYNWSPSTDSNERFIVGIYTKIADGTEELVFDTLVGVNDYQNIHGLLSLKTPVNLVIDSQIYIKIKKYGRVHLIIDKKSGIQFEYLNDLKS